MTHYRNSGGCRQVLSWRGRSLVGDYADVLNAGLAPRGATFSIVAPGGKASGPKGGPELQLLRVELVGGGGVKLARIGVVQAWAGWDAPFLRQDRLKRTPTTA
jgi:hypothetical protein